MQNLELLPFQKDGVQWLRRRSRAILADEQGLGKTPQAIMAWEPKEAVLVVATASKLRDWKEEIERWRPGSDVRIARDFEFPHKGEVIVCSWHALPPPIEEFQVRFPSQAIRPLTVVFDEAHLARNLESNRGMTASVLSEYADRAWLLTGTPLVTDPEGLRSLVFVANPKNPIVSDRWFEWGVRRERGGRALGCRWFLRWKIEREILRRTKAEVLKDLPPKSYHRWTCQVDSDLGLPEFMNWLRSRQGQPDRSWFSTGKSRLAWEKYQTVKARILHEASTQDPLIVFSASSAPIKDLEGQIGWAAIHGAVSSPRRAAIVRSFQAGELQGLAVTESGAEGLTLTRSHRMVLLDHHWNEAMNFQVEDRVHRLGQSKPVQIISVVSDHPLDQYILSTISRKEGVVSSTWSR